MRVRRTSGSVFGQEIFFEKSEIDQMCEEALRSAQMLPQVPEPIRIERFIEKHFGCQVVYEEVADGVLGCTAFTATGRVALVAISPRLEGGSDVGRRRSRATAAHEAGHCLMHAMLFMGQQTGSLFDSQAEENWDFKERRVLCRLQDIDAATKTRYDGRWWEYQANRAIGGFLLPRKLVSQAVSAYLEKVGNMGAEVLGPESRHDAEMHVVRIFDVNPIVAKIRLTEMYSESNQNHL